MQNSHWVRVLFWVGVVSTCAQSCTQPSGLRGHPGCRTELRPPASPGQWGTGAVSTQPHVVSKRACPGQATAVVPESIPLWYAWNCCSRRTRVEELTMERWPDSSVQLGKGMITDIAATACDVVCNPSASRATESR